MFSRSCEFNRGESTPYCLNSKWSRTWLREEVLGFGQVEGLFYSALAKDDSRYRLRGALWRGRLFNQNRCTVLA